RRTPRCWPHRSSRLRILSWRPAWRSTARVSLQPSPRHPRMSEAGTGGQPLPPGSTIGILGGGQLGRMLAMAAAKLGLRTHIYCDEPKCPAFDVSAVQTVGRYTDLDKLTAFAEAVDVVTYEFENVPVDAARHLVAMIPV